MNKTNDYKFNLPTYSDPVDIEDLNDNFRGIDDALMAGLCKKDYTGNNMGSSDPSARKYAWAPWFEIVNDNEFDVVVTDRNAPVESEEATINIAAGQTFRKYINGRYYMNFYVQDQHDVTFKWFTNAETYINESGGGGGGTGTVTSVSVQGGSGSHLTGSGNPIETSGTITINVDEGYSIPSDNEQTAWDGKAADLKAEIDSSTYVLTLQLKDSSGNLIGSERTIDLPLETMVVDGEYDSQTQKIKLELKNGNYVEFSVADLVSGLQTELSASNKLNPDYIAYDSSHRAVSDTEKNTWNAKQNAIDSDHKLSSSLVSFSTAEAAALASGIDSSKVGQISTNQTNILYALGKTGHNLLEVTATSETVSGVEYTVNKNAITISSNGSNTTSTFVLNSGSPLFKASNNVFAIDKVMPAGATITVKYTDGTIVGFNSNNRNTNTTLNNAKDVESIYLYIDPNKTINDTIKVMVCTQDDWEVTHEITPYQGAPNYDLTRLESEDRAGLVECVDGGAKNKLQNKATSKTENNVTFTVNSDGEVTVSTTAQGASANTSISLTGAYIPNTFVGNILSGLPSGSTSDKCILIAYSNNGSSETKAYYLNAVSAPIHEIQNYPYFQLFIWFKSGQIQTTPLKYQPMICTKAAFGVSNKFVPYRPNYDLVCDKIPTAKYKRYACTEANAYQKVSDLTFSIASRSTKFVSVRHVFSNAQPQGIAICISGHTPSESGYTVLKSEDTSIQCTSGLIINGSNSAVNYDVYVKQATANTNGNDVVVYRSADYAF